MSYRAVVPHEYGSFGLGHSYGVAKAAGRQSYATVVRVLPPVLLTVAALGLADNGTPVLEFANDQGQAVFRVPPAAGATPQERWVNYNAAGSRAFVQDRLEDAEKLYGAAIREAKAFGSQDLRLAASLNNLGVLYVKQQKFDNAADLYRGPWRYGNRCWAKNIPRLPKV